MKTSITTQFFNWSTAGQTFAVAYHTFGSGPGILFLPAMSTVSSRMEWQAVAAELSNQFRPTLVDWPGFGESSRLRIDYSPALFDAFLWDLVRVHFPQPLAIFAAGHAAGYLLRMVAAGAACWSRAILAAPTWCGPLPTAMGNHPRLYAFLRALVASPGLGEVLYRINTSNWFLRWMYVRHVFVNLDRFGPAFILKKQHLARRPGARFAAAAFVTGALDPFPDRNACCDALRRAKFPVLMAFGRGTPAKSNAEMQALARACPQQPLMVPGALGLHEECADLLIEPARKFLAVQT